MSKDSEAKYLFGVPENFNPQNYFTGINISVDNEVDIFLIRQVYDACKEYGIRLGRIKPVELEDLPQKYKDMLREG